MDAMPETIVSARIFNPATSIFKQPKSARPECTTITCTLASCPLRDAKTCMLTPLLGWTRCPYGRIQTESGPTRRAAGYSKWISDRRERYAGTPTLGYPATKMAFVGDYVYLPYAHMTMCKEVPFPQHDSMFVSGTGLLSKADWTFDTVDKLIRFRPRTYIDMREVVDYQQKSVPLFLFHLREVDPDMWEQVAAEHPELDTPADHRGRKALLRTLKAGISWTTSGGNRSSYPVTWRWDGSLVRTCSEHAYNKTWGDLSLSELEITATPDENAAIAVMDNCWVTEHTVFVD